MLWLIALFMLAMLIVIGHGAWVLLATIVKALFRTSKVERCRHCERFGAMSHGRCPWCGRAQNEPLNDEAADVAAIGRQLRRWQARGAILPGTVVRLMAKIEALQRPAMPPAATKVKQREAAIPIVAEMLETPPPPASPSQPRHTPNGLSEKTTAARPAEPSIAQAGLQAASMEVPPPASADAGAISAPPAAARPRKSVAEMLSTFMEERNIRWGELVGGLIIVCSSAALVISIWDQLKAIPYFQFFIFVAVSAALFGVGLYTEHRWKLTSTSRGVLVIATLLVPLNFVAMVATRRPGFDPLALVMELAALAVFSALVYRAGRILVEGWAAWLTLAVVGNSGLLLSLIGRPPLVWTLCVAGGATMLYAASLAKPLLDAHRREGLTATVANQLFILCGAGAFALAVAFSMIVVRGADHLETLHTIAPLLAIGALPIVLCGLIVMRGMAASGEAALRTAGTAVALIAAVSMLSAIAPAWPMPLSLIPVGLVNFASLAAIAVVYQLRPLHLVAAASLAIAYIVACHWAAGNLEVSPGQRAWALARLFIDGQTGAWLVGFAAISLASAEWLRRRERRADARYYLHTAAVAAAVSMALVSWPVILSGGAHSARAAWVYAAYGIAGLAINGRLRSRFVESLASALLYTASILGTTAWLIDQPWVGRTPAQLVSRPSLQCYAAACAAVSLAFVLLRVAARRSPRWSIAETTADKARVILRVITAASLLSAAWQATPGVMAELLGAAISTAVWANGTGPGWALFSLCAAGLLAALWDGWRDDDVTAAVLLSINAAVLAAIPAASSAATASALRWTLASTFAASAGLLWFRAHLANISRRCRCRVQVTAAAASTARAIWLVAAALPVVICSALVAAMQIVGQPAPGPLPGTWFARMGMQASHLVPLAMIVLTMIVYAIREGSAIYSFLGGMVANLTVTGGYALLLRRFDAAEAARLVQLATMTAALWAIGWLACRRSVLAWWRQPVASLARPLLRLQVAQAVLGSLLLLATATLVIFFAPADGLPKELHAWVASAGSPLGWFVIALACAAAVYRMLHFREGVRAEFIGLLGLVFLSLAASSVEAVLPGTAWPYRTLMLGWAIYAVAIVVAASRAAVVVMRPDQEERLDEAILRGNSHNRARLPVAEGREDGLPSPSPRDKTAWEGHPPRSRIARGDFIRAAAIWVRVSGLLAVALALKTVLVEGIRSEELLWAAPAIGIASAACAAMAVWLKLEGWAFTAGLGANLAASLIVAHRLAVGGHAVGEEWILLWQANTTAAAVVAIVWLTAWRRMYARPISSAVSPLLTLQVNAVAASALGLVSTAIGILFLSPNGQSLLAARLASDAGWFAWLSACAAVAGYLYHVARRAVIDLTAVFLLGAGVRLAIARFAADPATGISALASACIGAGFLLLVVGFFSERWFTNQASAHRAEWLRDVLNRHAFERWVAVIPVLVAVVALRGVMLDAASAEGFGMKLLAAAALPAMLAIWLRTPWHLYTHALLIQLVASLFWYAQPDAYWTDLLWANTLASATIAIFWSLCSRLFGRIDLVANTEARESGGWGRAWPNQAKPWQDASWPGDAPVEQQDTGASPRSSSSANTPPPGAVLPQPPIEHAAALVGVSLLAIGALSFWFAAATASPLLLHSRLAWLATTAVAACCTLSLWDRRAAFADAGIYVTGLAAIALGLVEHGEQARMLVRLTAPCLAAWLCAAAAGARLAFASWPRLTFASRKNALSRSERRQWLGWFAPTQAAFAVLATIVSLWIGVGFESPPERLAGPITTALVLAAVLLMSATRDAWDSFWRVSALTLAAVIPAELIWCWTVGHDSDILRLHRQVALLSAFAVVVAACEWVASRRLAKATWLESIRRFLPLAIATLLVLLSAILVRELDYRAGMPRIADGTRATMPMALVAKLAVAAVVVELIVLALRYAIVEARDPLSLTLRGRTAYVYAAETLALVFCLHFRTTMPKLLPFSFVENWWTLLVMIVAFAGAGLSEWFRRRKLEVLSLPLARTAAAAPLVPVFALLLYLAWRPADVDEWLFHARLISDEAIFFLVALFYALQARLRRSLAAAGLSALAGNVGFWLLWHRLRLDFLVHPQLWLIPPALAVLAAEYINRGRLSRQQSNSVRYLALSVIYASSTADVFISHVGRDISLPLVLVLMALSVLGILAGMLLEIRQFIYLGFTFLLVDLSIMVYHAAWDLGHTWVFWAAGIAVGAAIIALFAVFEKRRNEAAKQVDSPQL